MPRGSSRYVLIPDLSKHLRAIKSDKQLRPTRLLDELQLDGPIDISPRGVEALERAIAKRRREKLVAIAKHLGVDPLAPSGWFKAFEALAQAKLQIGCLLVEQPSRNDGGRLWTEELRTRLLDEFLHLIRAGRSKRQAIQELAAADWVPYRPQNPFSRSIGRATTAAKERAVTKQLSRFLSASKSTAVEEAMIGKPLSNSEIENIKIALVSALFLARARRVSGQT